MLHLTDEGTRNELATVVAGRGLSPSEANWLARALVGAIRPNRDLPLLDLAYTLAFLVEAAGAGDERALIRAVFDPRVATAGALADAAAKAGLQGGGGATLARSGRTLTWRALSRSLALAETIALVDGSALLGDLVLGLRRIAADPTAAQVEDVARALARALHAWRMRCLPFARIERRLRRVMSALGDGGFRALDDAAILAAFQAEVASGSRPSFHGFAQLVATAERALRHGLDLQRLVDSGPLGGWPGGREHETVEAALADIAGEDDLTLEERLARVPESPKCLTKAERRRLHDLVSLDPLPRSRPLTTLRALCFDPVQAGIVNRQRRGSGGPTVAQRVRCLDAAPYPQALGATRALREHLRVLLRMALALRVASGGAPPSDPRAAAALAEGRRALKAMRREGFDAPPEAIRRAFAAVDEDLAALAASLDAFLDAAEALDGTDPLDRRFLSDCAIFSAAFAAAYLDTAYQGASDGVV